MRPLLSEWLREGPFTLALSAGFFGFFAHCGTLTVLEDEGILPARVAGASAGALVTGSWAAGVDAPRLAEILLALRREDFWDPRPGAGLLHGRLFRARLDAILPARTFAECRVPASMSVYDLLGRRVRAMDAGPLSPAIQASCAVPLMFHPVWIGGRPYVDGGVSDRPGLAGVRESERVLFHHLASRSPWRGTRSMEIPRRASMRSVVIDGLPRVGPFRLAAGAVAFEAARAGMKRALGRAIPDSMIVAA